MRIAVVGSAEDVGGFALAGLPVLPAETRPEVKATLRASPADVEQTSFLLVSAGAARLAPEALEELVQREGAPAVLVLPEAMSP